MFEVMFSIILLFLAFIGLIEIFHLVSLALFKSKRDVNFITILPMSGHNEDAEYILRNVVSKTNWMNSSESRRIICLDMNMDDETKQICDIFSKEYEYIEVCTLNELEDYIKKLS